MVRVQLARLVSAVATQDFDPHERGRFAEAADRVRKTMVDAGHLL